MRYTPEFKKQAVELYLKSNTSYAAVAKELGVDPSSLSDWVKQAQSQTSNACDNPFQIQEELRRLRRENARLKEENEILLKASAFFAKKAM